MFFDPLFSERGIPERVSNLARFDMSNPTLDYSYSNENYDVSFDKVKDTPGLSSNTGVIYWSDLKEVDWDEEINDMQDKLEERK